MLCFRNKLLCFLKHNVEERPSTRKDNVMSGIPARFCQPSNGKDSSVRSLTVGYVT